MVHPFECLDNLSDGTQIRLPGFLEDLVYGALGYSGNLTELVQGHVHFAVEDVAECLLETPSSLSMVDISV